MLEDGAAIWDSGIAVMRVRRGIDFEEVVPKMLLLPGVGQFLNRQSFANDIILPAPGLSYTEPNRWSS